MRVFSHALSFALKPPLPSTSHYYNKIAGTERCQVKSQLYSSTLSYGNRPVLNKKTHVFNAVLSKKGNIMQHAPIDTFTSFFLGVSLPTLFFLIVFCSILLRRYRVKVRRQKAIAAAFEIHQCIRDIYARADTRYTTCDVRLMLERAGKEFGKLREEAKQITSARQLAEIQLIATKEVIKIHAMSSMQFSPCYVSIERLEIEHRDARLKEELAVRRHALVLRHESELRQMDLELRDINEHIAKIRKQLDQFEIATDPTTH